MLRQRPWSGFPIAVRPLVWLAVAAIATSTSPLRAQQASAEEIESFVANAAENEADRSPTISASAAFRAMLASGSVTGQIGTGISAASTSGSTSTAPTPPAPNDDGTALRTAGYIAGAVGIAGFVLFAIAGIGAKTAHDRLDEDCNAGPCDSASHESDIADGKRLQTAANIGLATGLAGIGLGATLILLGGHSSSDATPAPPVATSAPNGGMITFAGRF